MKKIILFLLASLVGGVGFADPAFVNTVTPKQAYHALGSSVTSAAPTPTVSAPVSTPAPTQVSAPASPNFNNPSVSPAAQNDVDFETATNLRFQNEDAQYQAMNASISTISQTVSQLQQAVHQLQALQTQTSSKSGLFEPITEDNLDVFVGFGAVASLLLLFGFLIGFFTRRANKINMKESIASHPVGDLFSEENKSEYDFMSTHAAIPAKLDLARSYIAMGDHDQACGVLKTVLAQGNEEHQRIAQSLLTKINKVPT